MAEKTVHIYNETAGATSFQRFCAWSNEKKVLAQEIRAELVSCGHEDEYPGSLLDIGAGSGALTRLLAPMFSKVTAIEPGSDVMLSQLRDVGRLVGNSGSGLFMLVNSCLEDVDLQAVGRHDVVLAAFSMRYVKDQRAELVRLATHAVDKMFLLVDMSPVVGDFWQFYLRYESRVLTGQSQKVARTDVASYDYMPLLAGVFGEDHVRFRDVEAELTIPSAQDLVGILDFIYDVPAERIPAEVAADVLRDTMQSSMMRPDGSVVLKMGLRIYSCAI